MVPLIRVADIIDADSLFLDCGGATQLVGAFNGSVVFNRTAFKNVVQRRAPHDFQPKTAGGPGGAQYFANGFFVATGDTSSILVQVRAAVD